ncbi:hypothetical protein DFS33DRAFT_1456875 [Desarmillaria ectypa]|nr:hypothetical protein DFS33DRAFT_1456875 [Desarmillaria ectypa]
MAKFFIFRTGAPNLKELFIHNEHGNHLVGPQVESVDEVGHLLRFVERSECNVQTFFCFRPTPLSTFRGLWKQWSLSLTKLAIAVTSTTQMDVIRELTFEEGKPGTLPNLQYLTLCTPVGVSIFKDDSLLKMASSRLTRRPGNFTKLAIMTGTFHGEVLSQDIITQMKRLREMRARELILFAMETNPRHGDVRVDKKKIGHWENLLKISAQSADPELLMEWIQ